MDGGLREREARSNPYFIVVIKEALFMKTTIGIADLPDMFESVGQKMAEMAEELCAMDAKMGDGDLGLTMKKGYGALPQVLRDLEEEELSKKLMKGGMKMSSIVPSTMGTLMSSGIMQGGKALAGKSEIDAAGYCDFLKGFCDGLIKRGKCARGDRTVLDAFGPAADAAAAALAANPDLTLAEAAQAALEGAKAGVEATRDMVPKFGKAAVHKDAAVGTVDQGAVAGCCVVEAFCNYITK